MGKDKWTEKRNFGAELDVLRASCSNSISILSEINCVFIYIECSNENENFRRSNRKGES